MLGTKFRKPNKIILKKKKVFRNKQLVSHYNELIFLFKRYKKFVFW